MTDVKEVYEMVTKQRPPEPGALERQQQRQVRVARNKKIGAFAVAAAIVALAVVALRFSWGDGGQQSATSQDTGPMVTPEYPGRVGLIGLPPEGAEASTPKIGEVVLDITFGHAFADAGRFSLWMYADGRVIWWRLGDGPGGDHPRATGLIEQRLTPEGTELVRSEVLSTGLVDRDLYFESAHGLFYGNIEILDGDGPVRVSWGNASTGGAPEGMAPTTPTPEQASALQRLDARLESLASWLPAGAWEDEEMKPFVPSTYSICFSPEQIVDMDVVLNSLPQPAWDLLPPQDLIHESYLPAGGESWCSSIATEEARALARILDDAGFREVNHDPDVGYSSESRGAPPGGVEGTIFFTPVLPHGEEW